MDLKKTYPEKPGRVVSLAYYRPEPGKRRRRRLLARQMPDGKLFNQVTGAEIPVNLGEFMIEDDEKLVVYAYS